jgi:hypothetical protein
MSQNLPELNPVLLKIIADGEDPLNARAFFSDPEVRKQMAKDLDLAIELSQALDEARKVTREMLIQPLI